MGKEIKVVPQIVEESLHELHTSHNAFKQTFNQTVEGSSALELVHTLVEIMESYADVISQYHSLLGKNIHLTRDAVESLQTTDREVAEGIKLMK